MLFMVERRPPGSRPDPQILIKVSCSFPLCKKKENHDNTVQLENEICLGTNGHFFSKITFPTW